MNYNIIVATDNKGGIGFNNSIPWYIKNDLKMFSKLTKGNNNNCVIMGRKTWESLPKKPLPNRINIILSSNLNINDKTTKTFKSIKEICEYCLFQNFENCWVIGGENIYKDFISQNLIDYIHLTIIEDSYICDKHFDFNQNKYKLIELNEKSEIDEINNKEITCKYCVFKKIN